MHPIHFLVRQTVSFIGEFWKNIHHIYFFLFNYILKQTIGLVSKLYYCLRLIFEIYFYWYLYWCMQWTCWANGTGHICILDQKLFSTRATSMIEFLFWIFMWIGTPLSVAYLQGLKKTIKKMATSLNYPTLHMPSWHQACMSTANFFYFIALTKTP